MENFYKKSLVLLLGLITCFNGLMAQSVSGPKLLYPANGAVLQQANPTFSWVKALPLTKDVIYDLKVVEMLTGQTPEAAILSNPSWYVKKSTANNLTMYPITAPLFQAGKKYAWQVVGKFAHNTNLQQKTVNSKATAFSSNEKTVQVILPSEVFWFEIDKKMQTSVCVAKSVTSEPTAYIIKDGMLRFSFPSIQSVAGNRVSYTINDEYGNAITSKKIIPEKVGDYYQIPLKQFKQLRKKSAKGKYYYLEAIDKQTSKKYQVKFSRL